MIKRILGLTAIGILMTTGLVQAQTKPLQLALIEDIQLVPATDSIKGLRLNIYGVNEDVMGLSLGFVNKSLGNTSGAELGLINITDGEFHGWQSAWAYSLTRGRFIGLQQGIVTVAEGDFTGLQGGIYSQVDGNFKGVQSALVGVTKGDYSGWQANFVNWTEGKFIGVQSGLLNITKANLSGIQLGAMNKVDGTLKGGQLGIVNCSGETQGLQLGFLNHSKMLNGGLQIGLGNINENKDPFGFLPFVNWSF